MATPQGTLARLHPQVDAGRWWNIARRCPYASFSHTPAWQELICRAYPDLQPATVAAECDNGTQVVFPLMCLGHAGGGRLRGLASTFAGCYGGPIADGPVPPGAHLALYRAVLGDATGTMEVCGNPYAPQQPPAGLRGSRGRRDHSLTVDLHADQDLWRGVKRGHRSKINRARRMGVATRAAVGLADYRRYYALYEETLARWGEAATSRYPWALFAAGAALAERYPECIRLMLAEYQGRVVAGAWTFAWNQCLYYWHGACDQEALQTGVNHLLHYVLMQQAVDEGLRYYDFYPSGGHHGAAQFKLRFGAQAMPLLRWRYRAPVQRLLDDIRRVAPRHRRQTA